MQWSSADGSYSHSIKLCFASSWRSWCQSSPTTDWKYASHFCRSTSCCTVCLPSSPSQSTSAQSSWPGCFPSWATTYIGIANRDWAFWGKRKLIASVFFNSWLNKSTNNNIICSFLSRFSSLFLSHLQQDTCSRHHVKEDFKCGMCNFPRQAVAACNQCACYLCKACVDLHNGHCLLSHTAVEFDQFRHNNNSNHYNNNNKNKNNNTEHKTHAQSLIQPIRSSLLVAMPIECTICQLGSSASKLNSPSGFCLSDEGNIVVADTLNHRIQVFDERGHMRKSFSFAKVHKWQPLKVTTLPISGNYVVMSGYKGNEWHTAEIFDSKGKYLKHCNFQFGGNVTGLAINRHNDIVILNGIRIYILCSQYADIKEWFSVGRLVDKPADLAIHNDEYFVCDSVGHRVLVLSELGRLLRSIGNQSIIRAPCSVSVSRHGDVLMAGKNGDRLYVAMFSVDGSFINAFECPQLKLSTCCGLQITDNANVIAIDKSKHRIIICNTLTAHSSTHTSRLQITDNQFVHWNHHYVNTTNILCTVWHVVTRMTVVTEFELLFY